jgi:hypothetical protein
MYACVLETGRGFFEGVCAPCKTTAHFSDPPTTQLFANGSPLAQRDRRFSPQRISIHCFHMVCLVISDVPGYRPSSTHKGWEICRMPDMDFCE